MAGDALLVGIDLGREPVPDETTACRLRHRLAAHDLGRRLFDAVPRHLAENGLRLATGTIVDAVLTKAGIIAAPSSTKNARKARDPAMHQTRNGNQGYFGMKAHLARDSRTRLIHAAAAPPANVADSPRERTTLMLERSFPSVSWAHSYPATRAF